MKLEDLMQKSIYKNKSNTETEVFTETKAPLTYTQAKILKREILDRANIFEMMSYLKNPKTRSDKIDDRTLIYLLEMEDTYKKYLNFELPINSKRVDALLNMYKISIQKYFKRYVRVTDLMNVR